MVENLLIMKIGKGINHTMWLDDLKLKDLKVLVPCFLGNSIHFPPPQLLVPFPLEGHMTALFIYPKKIVISLTVTKLIA